jgi:hypothetical protein
VEHSLQLGLAAVAVIQDTFLGGIKLELQAILDEKLITDPTRRDKLNEIVDRCDKFQKRLLDIEPSSTILHTPDIVLLLFIGNTKKLSFFHGSSVLQQILLIGQHERAANPELLVPYFDGGPSFKVISADMTLPGMLQSLTAGWRVGEAARLGDPLA